MPRFGIDENIIILDGLNDNGLAVVTIPEVEWGEDAEEWLTKEDAKALIAHLQKVFNLPVALEYEKTLTRLEQDVLDVRRSRMPESSLVDDKYTGVG